ncbi:MAG: AAA family ATPase [Clostridiales bacterium]|nr:AAA family ATPase [Clostridiales bacterium]
MYTFDDVAGNKNIVKYLRNIINGQKIPHAFIIDGAGGAGKTFISDIFAKALQCEGHGPKPCLNCVSCKAFDNKNHPDVFYIGLQDKKTIGVDEIRTNINKPVSIKPYRGKYKVFLIDDADKLTVQAQNALLKTIEEPPAYAVFIFMSENYKMFLPTVLSRCVLLKLKPLPESEIKQYLEFKKSVPEASAGAAAFYSEGSIGKALDFINDDFVRGMRGKVTSFLSGFRDKDLLGLFASVKLFEEYKPNIKEVLDFMYAWFRDVLVFKETKDADFVLDKENLVIIQREAFLYPKNKLYNILDAIDRARYCFYYNSNFNLTVEVMLIAMME